MDEVFNPEIKKAIDSLKLEDIPELKEIEARLSFLSQNTEAISYISDLFNKKAGKEIITPELRYHKPEKIVMLYENREGIEGLLADFGDLFKEELPKDKNVLDYADNLILLANSNQNFRTLIEGLEKRGMKPTLYRTIAEDSESPFESWRDSLMDTEEVTVDFARNQEEYFSFIDNLTSRGFEFSPVQKISILSVANMFEGMMPYKDKIFALLELAKEYNIKPDPNSLTADVILPLAEYTPKLKSFFEGFSKYGEVNPPNLISKERLSSIAVMLSYSNDIVQLAKVFFEKGLKLNLHTVICSSTSITSLCADLPNLEKFLSLLGKNELPSGEVEEVSSRFCNYYKQIRPLVQHIEFTTELISSLRKKNVLCNLHSFTTNNFYFLDTTFSKVAHNLRSVPYIVDLMLKLPSGLDSSSIDDALRYALGNFDETILYKSNIAR